MVAFWTAITSGGHRCRFRLFFAMVIACHNSIHFDFQRSPSADGRPNVSLSPAILGRPETPKGTLRCDICGKSIEANGVESLKPDQLKQLPVCCGKLMTLSGTWSFQHSSQRDGPNASGMLIAAIRLHSR
jgi:hypothetical protein